jgi:hypothetical protein
MPVRSYSKVMLYGGAAAVVRPTLDEHVEQGIPLTSF